ncbi:MAG TPA: DUF4180 domain-containing protein [Clostridium sp.]|nr:DUF4180 domain-containing protein [Clostridium sp.]
MDYRIVNKNDKRYIEYISKEMQISSEQDVLDIIGSCMEHSCNYVMLHGEVFSEDFFNLRTGLAGTMLQKLINYNIRAAAIIANEEKIKGRFGEMVFEANKGNDFRVFKNVTEAENWLLS